MASALKHDALGRMLFNLTSSGLVSHITWPTISMIPVTRQTYQRRVNSEFGREWNGSGTQVSLIPCTLLRTSLQSMSIPNEITCMPIIQWMVTEESDQASSSQISYRKMMKRTKVNKDAVSGMEKKSTRGGPSRYRRCSKRSREHVRFWEEERLVKEKVQ